MVTFVASYLRDFDLKSASVLLLGALLLCPIAALAVLALGDSEGIWPHLLSTVLGRYLANTAGLMVGVACLSLFFGVGAAWIVSRYQLGLSRWFDVVMLLPMACPAYLVAYAYTDVFEYAGPIQGALRQMMGWKTAQDYYFPEIRSMGGAIFVLSSVLYPYIYLLARTAFQKIPASFYEVAALSDRNVFWRVCLPLARPAIVAGLALVLMEVVSDFGTVEYFAVQTLTLGIFNLWIGMNSVIGAAQLATLTFGLIIFLLFLEFYARGDRRFNDTGRRHVPYDLKPAGRKKTIFLVILCLLPVAFGFLIPVSILFYNVVTAPVLTSFPDVLDSFGNSIFVSLVGAFVIMGSAIVMGSAAKMSHNKALQMIANLSAAGYAFPGTMLALGVLTCLSFADGLLEQTSLYFAGTFWALFFAYLVRFQAVGYGAVSSGLTKIPMNLISCSRSLGMGPQQTARRVTLPLMRNALLAGCVLAFVDIMKELPMTLLLRPFDFDTLATYAYQFAHIELMDQAALPALIIICAGLIPVMLLNRLVQHQ